MMFTDEKLFTKNGYFNPKNDVIWADDRSDANKRGELHSMQQYPVSVMVAVGATWYGLTRLYFFLKGEHLTDQSYQDKLLPFYKEEEKWPPNSPELNPLDYFIWDNISNHVKYHKVKTINDLRQEVEKAMKKVDINYVWEVIGAFLRRVYSVEKHCGELMIRGLV
ncbi:unnamed protein product [Rotaria magnacalcarata]|uniref:Tc1-like transposase DDE domain-containing protein n=1 Tax=Rotaria magnacalcarata TaxID=392030 RepID=A0A820KED2_9BILA|nr:unnamed protein product [Rotaria magnacalcarata]